MTDDLERKLSSFEITKKLITEKKNEIVGNITKMYNVLKNSGFELEFEDGKYQTNILVKKEGLFVLVGDGSWGNLYTIVAQPKKGGLVEVSFGTGDSDKRSEWNREPQIPEGRDLPYITMENWYKTRKTTIQADNFFQRISELYPKHPERITLILDRMTKLPNKIADHLEMVKREALKTSAKSANEAISRIKDNMLEENEILLHLYKVKPKIFKVYFESITEKQQIEVCEEILGLKNPNKEVDAWIGQNYPKMIETASRDRITKKMEDGK